VGCLSYFGLPKEDLRLLSCETSNECASATRRRSRLPHPGCVVGTKFGHGSLHVGDKIFAFARTDESAAIKLPEVRIAELLEAGGEMHLLQMGQRTMREWLVVPNAAAPENLPLLREAMAYVASLPPEKKRAKKKSAKRPGRKSVAKKAGRK